MFLVFVLCSFLVSTTIQAAPADSKSPVMCKLTQQPNIVYRCHYKLSSDEFHSSSASSLTYCDEEHPNSSVVYTLCKDPSAELLVPKTMTCLNGSWSHEAQCVEKH